MTYPFAFLAVMVLNLHKYSSFAFAGPSQHPRFAPSQAGGDCALSGGDASWILAILCAALILFVIAALWGKNGRR